MKEDLIVVIKGAGEMASGVAWRLHKANFRILMTEFPNPLAVRRAVSFCEAVHERTKAVEGVSAVLVSYSSAIFDAWNSGQIPVIVDAQLNILSTIQPDVLVEATVSKRSTGIHIDDAPLVIALGPGYEAGADAHMVVETRRGHNLGRLYERGFAQPNTGIPGEISGVSSERVIRAPVEGVFEAELGLGDQVVANQIVGNVSGTPVFAQIEGILRGLIRDRTEVWAGLKVGDVDPRNEPEYVHTISEKARSLGGAVLEGICRVYN